MKLSVFKSLACACLLTLVAPTFAQSPEIVIGINLSLTGPASTLGVPERNALAFVPKEIGGVKLNIVVMDDATDRWTAGANARRLATESKADVLIGSATTPGTLAVALVADEFKIPQIGLAPMSITPARRKWSVLSTPPTALMGQALYSHMVQNKVKKVGYLGYAEPYGDLWFNDLDANSEAAGIRIVDDQRFGRGDTSVTGQVLQLIAANPDAILIGASGSVAALPQATLRKNGYKGLIYQTHGAAGPEFLSAAGVSAENVVMVAPPVMAPDSLPDTSPIKPVAMSFVQAYEARNGPQSRNLSASHMYDAFEILKRVIPVALASAKPGTPAFRDAIRAAMLTERNIIGAGGVYNYSETDRYGQDARSGILITVKEGKFVALK